MTEEAKLLQESIQGDAQAFEGIVRRYQALVCAITFSGTGRVDVSEELAQDTFLSAWKNLHQLTDLSGFRPWLCTIARNIIKSHYSKKSPIPLDPSDIADIVDKSDSMQSQPDQLINQEEHIMLEKALMNIPAEYRQPLVMYYRFGKSTREVALELGLNEATLRTRLHRARQMLREEMGLRLERTIEQTAPGDTFTKAVMLTIGTTAAGLAASAAATATAASVSAGVASTFASTIAAKAVASVVAVIIIAGSIFAYQQIRGSNPSAVPAQQASRISAATSIDVNDEVPNLVSEPFTSESEPIANQSESFSSASSVIGINSDINENTHDTEFVPEVIEQQYLLNDQIRFSDSPYNHFLFTVESKDENSKTQQTIVHAEISDDGIKYSEYPYNIRNTGGTDYLCVKDGIFYAVSFNNLMTYDLNFPGEDGFESINFQLEHYHDYRDGKLYGYVQNQSGQRTFRVMDFNLKAYRDIVPSEYNLEYLYGNESLVVSEDHKKLAFYTRDPNGLRITIVDTDTGKVSQSEEEIFWQETRGSSIVPSPTLCWVNDESILTIRSDYREVVDERIGDLNFTFKVADGPNKLALYNTKTGQFSDVTSIPTGAHSGSMMSFTQDHQPPGPLINFGYDFGSYRLDISAGKLVEEERLKGDYYLIDKYLYLNDKELGYIMNPRYLSISPDGERALWLGDGKLYFHDSAQELPRIISKGNWVSYILIWFTNDDLADTGNTEGISAGWTAFEDYLPPVPKPKTLVENPTVPLEEALSFEIRTDKTEYLLHEPVEITLTLTNISSDSISVIKPVVFESCCSSRYMNMSIEYNNGSSMLDVWSESFKPERIEAILEPGESIIVSDILELASADEYRIKSLYESPVDKRYSGRVKAESSLFRVVPVDDEFFEKELFEAKFNRLIERLYAQREIAPNSTGSNNIIDDRLRGIPGMGPKAAPYLIDIIETEPPKNLRDKLYRALTAVADENSLPFFVHQLEIGKSRPACSWLHGLYRKNITAGKPFEVPLNALVAAMQDVSPKVRQDAFRELVYVFSPDVIEVMTQVAEGGDQSMNERAARYLAAAEWLDLVGWFALAVEKPTYIRYKSACYIIDDIEHKWNITQGQLPLLTKSDFQDNSPAVGQFVDIISKWQKWARENYRYSFHYFENDRDRWIIQQP